jgi:hypothetical protein
MGLDDETRCHSSSRDEEVRTRANASIPESHQKLPRFTSFDLMSREPLGITTKRESMLTIAAVGEISAVLGSLAVHAQDGAPLPGHGQAYLPNRGEGFRWDSFFRHSPA